MQDLNALWTYIARNYNPTQDHLTVVNDQFNKIGNLNLRLNNTNEYLLILLASQPTLYPYLSLAFKYKIDLNVHNKHHQNALSVAHRSENLDAIKLLLTYKKNEEYNKFEEVSANTLQNALSHIINNLQLQQSAAHKESLLSIWKKFYQQFPDEYQIFIHTSAVFKTICQSSPLSCAFIFGNIFRPPNNELGKIPLLGIVVRLNRPDLVKKMLESGFDPNIFINGIPLLALVPNNEEIIIDLITYGAKVITEWQETKNSYQNAIKWLENNIEPSQISITESIVKYKSIRERIDKNSTSFFKKFTLSIVLEMAECLTQISETRESYKRIENIRKKDSAYFYTLVCKIIIENCLYSPETDIKKFIMCPTILAILKEETEKNIQPNCDLLYKAALYMGFEEISIPWLRVASNNSHQQTLNAVACGIISTKLHPTSISEGSLVKKAPPPLNPSADLDDYTPTNEAASGL